MRCRNIDPTSREVVWFNSVGSDSEGKKIEAKNYSENGNGLQQSLQQNLSVLQGELWHSIYYGLPLVDKANKAIVDSEAQKIILSKSNVIEIEKFQSWIVNHTYSAEVRIKSDFGTIELSI